MFRRRMLQRIALFGVGLAVAAPVAGAEEKRPGGARLQGIMLEAPDLWWNQPDLVQTLELSAEQREQMDAAWTQHRRQVGEYDAAAARARYEKALAGGDWKAARAAIGQVTWRRTAELELKIRIFELLSAEQREALVAARPALIATRWGQRVTPSGAKRQGL